MPPAPSRADLVIEARWVLPIEPQGVVLADHAVVVDAGRIVALLPIDVARAQYAAAEQVRLREHVLMPGLVNLHTHAAMSVSYTHLTLPTTILV